MLLYFESTAELRPEDLLARPDKQGRPAVRGPLIRADSPGTPLAELRDGDKLHIVGAGSKDLLSGYTAEALVGLLVRLGLCKDTRLKQIHLVADETGAGEDASYAYHLAQILERAGYKVDEFKAPLGAVRCDERGKIWIRLSTSEEWLPSSSALNYYTGANVQQKHRK